MQLSKTVRSLLRLLLAIWIIVLCKFIFFKHTLRVINNYFRVHYASYSWEKAYENSNFIPFKSIRDIYTHPAAYEFKVNNHAGNILGFVPLGLLLALLFERLQHPGKLILAVFIISLFFEVLQFVSGLGIFDVDDLLLNSLGGFIGYGLFTLFKRLRTRHGETIFYND